MSNYRRNIMSRMKNNLGNYLFWNLYRGLRNYVVSDKLYEKSILSDLQLDFELERAFFLKKPQDSA